MVSIASAPASTSKTRLPPGPRLPKVAQLVEWAIRPIEVMQRLHRKHGEAFTLMFPLYGPQVFFSNPEVVKEIFTGSTEVYQAGKANSFLEPLVGQNSLLLLDSRRHLSERKMVLPPFHGERMHAYGETMLSITRASIATWPYGQMFQIHPVMQSITLDIIFSTVFGLADAERNAATRRLRERVRTLLQVTANPLLLMPWFQLDVGPLTRWAELKRLKADIDRMILEAIAERRRAKKGGDDVLSMLVEARDEEGYGLNDEQLLDEMVTLLVAGHETTATALSWAVYHLLTNLDVLDALGAEIDRVTAGGPIRLDHLPKLELLDGVVRETLRLTPVIPVVGRYLNSDQEIGGWSLPKGSYALPCTYLVHRRPEIYPQPDRFMPSRYASFRPSPYEFLPFGGGVRRCVGMAFAMYEMKVVLAELVASALLRLAPKYRARVFHRSITLAPKGGVPVLLSSRKERRERGGGIERTDVNVEKASCPFG